MRLISPPDATRDSGAGGKPGLSDTRNPTEAPPLEPESRKRLDYRGFELLRGGRARVAQAR